MTATQFLIGKQIKVIDRASINYDKVGKVYSVTGNKWSIGGDGWGQICKGDAFVFTLNTNL